MLAVNQLSGFGSGGGPPPAEVLVTDNTFNNANTASYSFAGVLFGPEDPDRYIVVAFSSTQSGARTFSSVTIGGIAATMVNEVHTTNGTFGMFIAKVPTGTSGTVVVNLNSAATRAALGVWQLTKLLSATPVTATSVANPLSASVTAQPGGVTIGAAAGYATSAQSFIWTGLLEDYDATSNESSNYMVRSGASASSPSGGGLTSTATPSGVNTNYAMILATFR